MEKKWTFKDRPDPGLVKKLQEEINVSGLMGTLLAQRGIKSFEEAKTFFRPSLTQLHDPFLMKDMDKAVNRIENALEEGQKVMVYGDYDVDGTTSVALVYSFLKVFYDNLLFYIPDRYEEGYGVSYKGIDFAKQEGVSLIIALDCGIKAVDKIAYANEQGIDFIICDHHRPGPKIPKAVAVLDPKRPDCDYPYKELSGCGIGFKLLQALCAQLDYDQDKLLQFIDLTAISIACDIVPITGENRVLAYFGLKKLNKNPRKGLAKLIELTGKKGKLNISSVVFMIGPRINAAGRIEHGKQAVELLVSGDESLIEKIGTDINENNNTRRGLDKEITEQALNMIRSSEDLSKARSTVLFSKTWHKGVIGIVASRLTEHYHRPTIMLTEANGVATGSARSVSDFDIYNAIEACSDVLEQFGGHKYAAGLTLKTEQVEEFRMRFEQAVSGSIQDHQLVPEEVIDAEANFEDITYKFYNVMQQMAPFGPENMTPVFCTRGVYDNGYSRAVGDGSHLKLSVYQGNQPNKVISGIAFGYGHLAEEIAKGREFDIAYTVEENVWNDQRSLQLVVKDIKIKQPGS